MDIDFPLVLTSAVLLSGLIWALDSWFFRPRRLAQTRQGKSGQGKSRQRAKGTDRAAEDAQDPAAEPIVVEYAKSFFPVLLFVLVLRSFVVEPYQIPSGSMIPTLEIGDFILVNKYAYGLRLPVLGTKVLDVGAPERGDVMVFIPKHESEYFIKRVIGLPGDEIRYQNKTLYVNGERQGYEFVREFTAQGRFPGDTVVMREYAESLGDVVHPIHRATFPEAPAQWQVPAEHYFMMGDNRDDSFDSRGWSTIQPDFAFVPEANIVGRAFAIWMHMPGWVIPSFGRNQRIN